MLYFIVNEKSGSGRGAHIWRELCALLKEDQIPYQSWCTEYEGHATALAGELCLQADPDIRLIVLGGDGTVNEVLNGITDFGRIRFGLIPTGSGNDFARGLGIQGTSGEQLRDLLANTNTEAIDLGKVTFPSTGHSRLFAISSGMGMDALVCKHTNTSRMKRILNRIHLGKLSYLFITVYSLFTMQTARMTAVFDQNAPQHFPSLIFSGIMNFRAEGGGIPMSPRASAMDGMLSVCTVNNIPKWLTFFYLPLLALGRHERLKAVNITDCTFLSLHTDTPVTVHADGEYLGDYTDVQYECLPGMLRMIKYHCS